MQTVVGVLPTRREAEALARELNVHGIPFDEVIIADENADKDHDKEWNRRNISAAAACAWGWAVAGFIPSVAEREGRKATWFGACAGGAVCFVLAVAILYGAGTAPAIPGGAVSILLLALAIGGTAGASTASLYNFGVCHEQVPLAREAYLEHGLSLSAHVVEGRVEEVKNAMKNFGATRIRSDADGWKASGWAGAHPIEAAYPSDSTVRSH